MRSLRRSRAERVTCANCATGHAPHLTAGACPVCGVDSGIASAHHTGLDSDQRLIAVVGVTMIANLLILGGLALLYLQL